MMAAREHKPLLRGVIRYQEPMAQHTSWRTGGPADIYYIPADLDDLRCFLAQQEAGTELFWLGLGSNVLVRDRGIRGAVIAVTGILDELRLTGATTMLAGAGVTSAKAARFAAASGLAGAEFLAGIPGTIGGALAMNAGAFGGETWRLVQSVQVIDRGGAIATRRRDAFQVGYRQVNLAPGEWFLGAEFALQPDHDGRARERIRELLAQRSSTQPAGESSCGSVFRNPPGDYAGRLIEACGLKGRSIGAAQVSEKHANFIINRGGASAADIEALILLVRQEVRDATGVDLVPEVRIIGLGVTQGEERT